MKKTKLSSLLILSSLALSLASCDINTSTTTKTSQSEENGSSSSGTQSESSSSSTKGETSSESSSSSSSSSSGSTSTTTSSSIKMNENEASGLAPVVTLNTLDTSNITTEETATETEVLTDTTLSGNYYNGVRITTEKKGSVILTLNNATIYQNSDAGKALYNENKNVSVTLNLPEGTTSYIYNNTEDTNAIHIKGTLNITGSGKLVVISGTKSAIKCNGLVSVKDASLELSALNYGINAEEVELEDANVNVVYAGKDGIRAEVENEEVDEAPTFDSTIGYVNLTNTVYNATVCGDGIQANTTLTIKGGTTEIKTQGSFVSYTSSNIEEYELEDDDFKWSKSGSSYKKMSSDVIGTNYSKYLALTQSSKGLKVGALKYTLATDTDTELEVASTEYNLVITDGAIVNITSTDSGSKVDYGDTTISGGAQVSVNAGNKGFAPEHDFYLTGSDTVLTVTNSYEAVEASHIYFNEGTAYLSANDDGINAASDYSTTDYTNLTIDFNGAYVSVNGKGDGLDSNGTINFNSGTVLVLGPTSGADSAIDADSKIAFNGSFVLAIGASGMTETQNYTTSSSTYVIETTELSGSSTSNTLTIKSSDEEYTTTFNQSFGEIVFSSSKITSGSSYTFALNNNTTTISVTSNITTSGSNQGPNGGQGGNQNPGENGQGGPNGDGGRPNGGK